MQLSRKSRKVVRRFSHVDLLEPRQLLSATLTNQVPDQSLAAGQGTTLTLTNYFNDPTITAGDTVVNIQTNLPAPNNNIPLMLTDSATPQTVANFLQYITSGEYTNTIIHRSIAGFVIQGGGYDTDGTHITTNGTIPGESSTATLKNTTGTIAMALSTGPDSATSEWYFNLTDNSFLDDSSDDGPFTAFGSVIYNGMDTLNAIANLPTVDDTSNGAWTNLPVQNYTGTSGAEISSVPSDNDFVLINPTTVAGGLTYSVSSDQPTLATGSISNGQLTITPASVTSGGVAHLTITATDLGGGTAQSTFAVTVAPSSVTPGAAAQLVFATQPSDAVAGANLSPLSVDVEDQSGNVVNTDSSNVTLTSNPAGISVTVAAVNGVATFNNLSLNNLGAYTLTASDGSLTSATSNSFNITNAGPQLVFSQQPSSSVAGNKFSVQVNMENTSGATDTSDKAKIKLSISSGGKLLGTTTVASKNGEAEFKSLSIQKVGAYTLTATDVSSPSSFAAGQSSSIVITPAVAKKIAFSPQPTGATNNLVFNVGVELQDHFGNAVTDGSAITLALGAHPSGATLTPLTEDADDAPTEFALQLDTAGKYTLKASDGKLKATSKKFTVA